MDNILVAAVVVAFLGVFLIVGIVAILCKACAMCSESCGLCCHKKVGHVFLQPLVGICNLYNTTHY